MEFRCCSKNCAEEKEIEDVSVFLKTIADKNRLKLLCILQGESQCVCEIFPKIGISQKLASHHLGQLKKIGLVSEQREGNFIRYSINSKSIIKYKKLFNKIIKSRK